MACDTDIISRCSRRARACATASAADIAVGARPVLDHHLVRQRSVSFAPPRAP